MKRRSEHEEDRRLQELPPELRVFNMADWAREDDPPGDDEVELPTCTRHDRLGCVTCLGPSQTWSPDQRHSICFYERYVPALERWAWDRGLTLEDVLHVLAEADGEEAFGG